MHQAFDAPCRVSAHVRLRCVRSAPVSLTSTTHRRLINSTIPKTVLCCDLLLSPPSPLFIRSNMPTTTDPEHVQCLFKSKRGIFISHRYSNHFLLIIRYLWSFEKSIQISAIYHSIQYCFESVQTKEKKLASVQKNIGRGLFVESLDGCLSWDERWRDERWREKRSFNHGVEKNFVSLINWISDGWSLWKYKSSLLGTNRISC